MKSKKSPPVVTAKSKLREEPGQYEPSQAADAEIQRAGLDEWFIKHADAIDRSKMGSRIRACREQIGISQEALGRRLLHSKQFVSSIETGKTEVHRLLLISMARFFGVSLDYLITGAGDAPLARRKLLAPLVSAETLLAECSLDQLFERQVGSENSVWLRVTDDALTPDVRSTDTILADPERPVYPGDIVAVFIPQTRRIWVRRFAPLNALSSEPPYRLVAESDLYPPLEVQDSDAPRMLGPAIQLSRIEALRR